MEYRRFRKAEIDFAKDFQNQLNNNPNRSFFLTKEEQKEREINIENRLKLLDEFFNSLAKGYTEAFEKAGYICDIRTGKVMKKDTNAERSPQTAAGRR